MRKLLSGLLLSATMLLTLGVAEAAPAPAPQEFQRRSEAPRVYYPRHSVRVRAYRARTYRYNRYAQPVFRRSSERARAYRTRRYYRAAPYVRRSSEMPRRSY